MDVSEVVCHGEEGAPGEAGSPGEDGEPGEDAADGKDRADGRDGERGADGAVGEDGAGSSCSVEKTSGGGAKVICPDGSSVTIPAPSEPSGGCASSAGGASPIGLLAVASALSLRRRA